MSEPNDYQLLSNFLVLGAILMTLGTVGFVSRRNLVVMLLSVSIMFQGSLLTLVGFSTFHATWSGQVFSLFAIIFTILQAMLGMVVAVIFVRKKGSLDLSRWNQADDSRTGLSDEAVNGEPRGHAE